MSRAAVSKSRAEKGGKTQGSAPTPAISHEIVPGKFNDTDWNFMLERDDGDDFLDDIVEELCSKTMQIIHDKYIQRQLLPYTISQAKEAILQIIEWQFLSRDEGEPEAESDPSWLEDEEPQPAVSDCWAQGSVPKHKVEVSREPTPVEVEEPEEAEVSTEEPAETAPIEEPVDKIEENNNFIPHPPLEDTADKAIDDKKPESKESTKSKRKIKFKPYTGRLKSAGVSKMTESLEDTEMKMLEEEWRKQSQSIIDEQKEKYDKLLQMPLSCHSILKMQSGRPPGHKDVTYDEMGNVVAVMKINPDKLPTHRVKVKYHVIDPAVEAAQARLEAMRTGRYLTAKTKSKKTAKPSTTVTDRLPTTDIVSTAKTVNLLSTAGMSMTQQAVRKETVGPLPPPLIESMDVSPGVVVREGHRVKKGPRQQPRQADVITEQQLRPVNLHKQVPVMTVTELLEGQSPILRPLGSSPPIPPITPNGSHRQRVMMES